MGWTVTHDKLLARIEHFRVVPFNPLIDALRAVVELHQPLRTFPPESIKSIEVCLQCRDGDFMADYPCQTISEIEKALQ